MSVTELRNAPYNVLFEQAERFWAELSTDTKHAITGPLSAEGYQIPAFTLRLRQLIDKAKELHIGQTLNIVDADAHGPVISRAVSDAREYLISVELRALQLARKGVAPAQSLINLFNRHPAPTADGANSKDLDTLLGLVQQRFTEFQGDLPGLSSAFRARAATIRSALVGTVYTDERKETGVESSTLDAVAARDALVEACVEYVGMMDVVNHDRAGQGLPPLPGANLETVRQWAETRPGVVAERKAEAASAAP